MEHFDIDITYSGVPGPEGTVGAVDFGNFALNLEGNPNVVGTPSGLTVHMYDPTNVNKTYEFNILIPFVGVFILVYVANLIHQKILANKFNEKLNRK